MKPRAYDYLDRLIAAGWGDTPQVHIPREVIRAARSGRRIRPGPSTWRITQRKKERRPNRRGRAPKPVRGLSPPPPLPRPTARRGLGAARRRAAQDAAEGQ